MCSNMAAVHAPPSTNATLRKWLQYFMSNTSCLCLIKNIANLPLLLAPHAVAMMWR